jgi:2-oxoglutarate ferredoxin oxidoreductase subunit beta
VPLIEAAVKHKGAAFIDVVSPCVTFNNHSGSTKSYDYVRAHNEAVNMLDVILRRDPIDTTYPPGSVQEVTLHDGGLLRLRKLHADYDPTDKLGAINYLHQRHAAGEVVTGLLYTRPGAADLHDSQNTVDRPLNSLSDTDLIPGSKALAEYNAALR